MQTEEWRPRQQHPKPGGTTERRGRRLEQEGRVAAPALHRWPCRERRVRVSNNGAKRRRESRVRPAVVEEVAPRREGWAGRRPPPLARWSLPARRASSAPSPGSSGSPTAARSREYGASARVNLVPRSHLFSFSPSSFTSCRCCLWVPCVWEYNSASPRRLGCDHLT